MLTMKNRILRKKLLFNHHLFNLGPDTLAFQIAEVQSKLGYPGLVSECEVIRKELGLPDVKTSKMSKMQWKRTVKEAIENRNRDDLLSSMTSYKKLDHRKLALEKYETKSYLLNNRMEDARLIFQANSKMMKTVKMNFKSNPKFIQEQWKCSACSRMDSQEHLLWCSGYTPLRQGLDLDKDCDIVHYYKSIINLRADDEN